MTEVVVHICNCSGNGESDKLKNTEKGDEGGKVRGHTHTQRERERERGGGAGGMKTPTSIVVHRGNIIYPGFRGICNPVHS